MRSTCKENNLVADKTSAENKDDASRECNESTGQRDGGRKTLSAVLLGKRPQVSSSTVWEEFSDYWQESCLGSALLKVSGE